VTALEPDVQAAAKAKKPAVPDYLGVQAQDIDEDGVTDFYTVHLIPSNAPAKTTSGKLYLTATLEGWNIKKSVVVNYTVKSVAPTVKYSKTEITVNPFVQDWAWTVATVTPNEYTRDELTVDKVVEGSTTYQKPSEIAKVLNIVPDGNKIFVQAASALKKDTKARTFKVYMKLVKEVDEETVETPLKTPFTVKTNPKEVTLSVKLANTLKVYTKDKENVDASGTLVVTPTVKNYSGSVDHYSVELKKDKETLDDVLYWTGNNYDKNGKYVSSVYSLDPDAYAFADLTSDGYTLVTTAWLDEDEEEALASPPPQQGGEGRFLRINDTTAQF
jgi:hypothetical protein